MSAHLKIGGVAAFGGEEEVQYDAEDYAQSLMEMVQMLCRICSQEEQSRIVYVSTAKGKT